jgi:cytochrome P450
MGADRAAETATLLAAAVEAASAGWQDGERVRLMPWLRPLVIRAVVGGAFASSLTAAEIATLEGVMRWGDAAPRVEGGGPSRHRLTRPLALARLSLVTRSLLANVDLDRPSELSALVLDHSDLSVSFGERERQALAGELLLGAVGPLVQSAGWALFRLATSEPPSDVQAFVREVARLHPTNPHITRTAVADTSVGGEAVPAHTRVIVDVASLHRDPRVYDRPEEFLPERWLGGRLPEHKFSYAAFGIGDRRCLGETIATTALAALVESVGRNWELDLGQVDVTASGRRQLSDAVTARVSRRR